MHVLNVPEGTEAQMVQDKRRYCDKEVKKKGCDQICYAAIKGEKSVEMVSDLAERWTLNQRLTHLRCSVYTGSMLSSAIYSTVPSLSPINPWSTKENPSDLRN